MLPISGSVVFKTLLNICTNFRCLETFHSFMQIIFNAAVTLMFSILTFYTFFRYVLQQNSDFEDISWGHFVFELLVLTSTLTSVYRSSRVSSEVNSCWKLYKFNSFSNNLRILFSSGTSNNTDFTWHIEFVRRSRNCGNGMETKINSLELNCFFNVIFRFIK